MLHSASSIVENLYPGLQITILGKSQIKWSLKAAKKLLSVKSFIQKKFSMYDMLLKVSQSKEYSVSLCFTKQKFMNYKAIIKPVSERNVEWKTEEKNESGPTGPTASKKCGPGSQIAGLGPAGPL